MSAIDAAKLVLAEPERLAGQGLDANQEESGHRAIHLLLTHPVVGPQTDLVVTYRDGAYEVWAQRGMVRFQRSFAPDGGHQYQVIETVGQNPIENQSPQALATIDEELEAARLSGNPTDDPNHTYIEPEQLSYPLAYERIAQLFDSPNAPDLMINPKCYASGKQAGQHGALDIVQSRAPLIFSGPGVQPGVGESLARQVDIAPTVARLMGFPRIEGQDATGRASTDVYLRRQDGLPLEEMLDLDAAGELRTKPERVYLFNLDGQSATELYWRLEHDPDAVPNMRRLAQAGHRFRYGSIVNLPSITWPSHNTIGTGCWGGHHDLVNNNYYLRETRQLASPYGQQFETAQFLGDQVETLHEAFHRVFGPWQGSSGAFTAAIHEPCGRGADHAVLERRTVGDRDRLRAFTKESAPDISPRWKADDNQRMRDAAFIDSRGIAQALELFTDDSHPPPIFTYHNFLLTDGAGHDYGPHHQGQRDSTAETDRRIGRLLAMLDERGLFDSTLFIITADHGMSPTRTELAANQGQLLLEEGMKAILPESWVYLLDMAVEIEHDRDNRTATVTVLANDADASGARPPVAGAEVTVGGDDGPPLASAITGDDGVARLPLAADLPPADVVITVRHDDYNARHLRLDGSSIALDLRELLYSGATANDA
ncbi:MAG: alkaline phosphatase family protein [Chloroflexi bacterium]|nr:alkaline phosphatase family protein [Chloroflexota bacterium]